MRNNKQNHSILLYENIPSGEEVWNGFIGGQTTCTAPTEPKGLWNLYEVVSPENTHAGWHWEIVKWL